MSDDYRQRYVNLITGWFEPGTRLARLGELLAVRDEELERLREERDQAIAHDRQPYPTQWAYDQACAALEKHRARAEQAERRAATAEERLSLARDALLGDGYFKPDEVGADVAPRIVERLSVLRHELEQWQTVHDCDPPDEPAEDSPREWLCPICRAAWDRVEHSEDEGEIYETWFEKRDDSETGRG